MNNIDQYIYFIKNRINTSSKNNIPTLKDLESLSNLHKTYINQSIVYNKSELTELENYKVPDDIINFYRQLPIDNYIYLGGDVNLLSCDRILRENTMLAPGAFLIKFGFITFATSTGGNAICLDLNVLNEQEPRVILADKSVFNGKEIITFNNGVISKDILSRNIINKYIIEVSSTFTNFLKMLMNNEIYDIEEYLD